MATLGGQLQWKVGKTFKTMLTWTPRILYQIQHIATSPLRNALLSNLKKVWFYPLCLEELPDTVGVLGKDLQPNVKGTQPNTPKAYWPPKSLGRKCAVDCHRLFEFFSYGHGSKSKRFRPEQLGDAACFTYRIHSQGLHLQQKNESNKYLILMEIPL